MAEDDPTDEITRIETRLEQLAATSEQCRKIIMVSKVAIAAGGAMLLLMVFGLFGSSAAVALGSIGMVLGGIVALGSNVSTLQTDDGRDQHRRGAPFRSDQRNRPSRGRGQALEADLTGCSRRAPSRSRFRTPAIGATLAAGRTNILPHCRVTGRAVMTDSIMFHEGNRRLQDQFGSRRISDRLEEFARTEFTPDDRCLSSARRISSWRQPTPRDGPIVRSRAACPVRGRHRPLRTRIPRL